MIERCSFWVDSARMPRFKKLDRDLRVDVAVIGGGMTGITAANLFKRAGCTVALLERGRCGGVDSSKTTAHLTCVTDERLHSLVDNFGKEGAKALWDAGRAAIDQIAANVRTEELSCEFAWVPGYLHAPMRRQKKNERDLLERDAALARALGFKAEFMESIPYFDVPGVQFEHQAKFHPLKYLSGMARTIPGKGSHVFESTEVTGVEEKPLAVTTAGKNKVRCDYVFLATHTPLMGKTNIVPATLFQTKLYLYSSYAVGAKLPPRSLPEALFWDTCDPYHYLRIDRRRGVDYAIFGGEDHKTGQKEDTEKSFHALEETLLAFVPGAEIDHRWSGQVIETNDGLPFIGETAKGQFAATGFGGNGMTFGTLGAMMAVDAFLKRRNPWSEMLSPDRKKLKGGLGSYLSENKDYPYYLIRDRIGGAEGNSLRALRRNEGKILRLGGKKVAGYRDADGNVTLCSPVCTHLGCIVSWNKAEKTWDCPCHGSRFKPGGEVLSGPAESDLEKVENGKGN